MRAQLRVDRALHGGLGADGDETRLEEGERDLVIVTRGRVHQPFALVILDLPAVLQGEGFELRVIESSAGHDQAVGIVLAHAGRGRDDVVDVFLDVDAGLGREFLLPFRMHGHGGLQPLPEVGIHDRADIGVGNDGRIGDVFVGDAGVAAAPTADGEWSDDYYAKARVAQGGDDPGNGRYDAEPAVDGDLGDDGRYETARAPDFAQ